MRNIEHVVVLMLENRSFDNLLGWLYEHDAPTQFIPPSSGATFAGLQAVNPNDFINTALDGALTAKPTRGAKGFTVPEVDPGEEFSHVNTQFFGTPAPAQDAPITMKGVLEDFVEILEERKIRDPALGLIAPRILQSYTPGQLPVLNQLARHYAVSDAWYASVPSQTNPNRSFLMCGTSNGMVNNGELETNPQARSLESVLGMAIGDDRVDAPTIFNALNDAGTDWKVFWQTSYLPQKISNLLTGLPELIPLLAFGSPALAAAAMAILAALQPYIDYLEDLTSGELDSCYTWRLFTQIRETIPNADRHFHKLDEFHRLARAGQLPPFSYIEPFWSIARSTNQDPIFANLVSALGNDYHPPANLLVCEQFVKEVYTSLISNRSAWEKTLLLITFDEFVGVFDHETDALRPGVVKPPWGTGGQPPFKSPTKFRFDRLGARVPTILVSPYAQKGTVFRSTTNVPYDHTSVIATTLKWLGQDRRIAEFGERASSAPTFEGALTLGEARTDEADLAFLDTPRADGDLVRYGDAFLLRNESGDYLSAFYCTMKAGGGGSVLSPTVMGICVDLGTAAYFPRVGGDARAVLSLVTPAADPPAQIDSGAQVMLVSREPGLGARNILGAWADSHDCYYENEYLDGDSALKQAWVVQKRNDDGQPLHYGEEIYLFNSFYTGQRLTRDLRWLVGSGWLTTSKQGDSWTIEPAPPRVIPG
jgi:phospholipase C